MSIRVACPDCGATMRREVLGGPRVPRPGDWYGARGWACAACDRGRVREREALRLACWLEDDPEEEV